MAQDKDPLYTTGEIAHVGWVIAKAAVRAARGKSPEKYSPELDAIKTRAQEREELERAARAKVEREKAEAKAKKKAERGW
jgi:hypothetical protein